MASDMRGRCAPGRALTQRAWVDCENECAESERIAPADTRKLRNPRDKCTIEGVKPWHPPNMTYVPFTKTLELMRLAGMAAARVEGVCLHDIQTAFGVNHRSAQRMARALEAVFPAVSIRTDEKRRRWWSLSGDERLLRLQGIRDDELAALEMGIRRATREGATTEARALSALRDRLAVVHPPAEVRRAEADAEATLQARGHACRPGPHTTYCPEVLEVIDATLKGPFRLEMTYLGDRDGAPRMRRVEPYGVLFGLRCYLVCREPGVDDRIRHFRLDRIVKPRRLKETFLRDPDFCLTQHAARSFGSYHSVAEFGPVIWRFDRRAAPVARDYVFHPSQVMQDDPEGGLIVTFEAGGWLEMAWHLYAWGDTVEVIAPDALRALVANHRHPDFPALP
ncbi:MAG: helix-turn-helix transcriptional regulator [Pararhodobacter sp.]